MMIKIGEEFRDISNRDKIVALVKQLMLLVCKHQSTFAQTSVSLEVYADHDADPLTLMLDIWVNGEQYRPVRLQATSSEVEALSPREREIVSLVAKGYPNKAIAQILEISHWTVSTHLRRIYSKLHVSSRAEMVAHVMLHMPTLVPMDPQMQHG